MERLGSYQLQTVLNRISELETKVNSQLQTVLNRLYTLEGKVNLQQKEIDNLKVKVGLPIIIDSDEEIFASIPPSKTIPIKVKVEYTIHTAGYNYIFDNKKSGRDFPEFILGNMYKFDTSHRSNKGHPLSISKYLDEFTPYNIKSVGDPGTPGAYVLFVPDRMVKKVYVYCKVHGYDIGSIYNPINIIESIIIKPIIPIILSPQELIFSTPAYSIIKVTVDKVEGINVYILDNDITRRPKFRKNWEYRFDQSDPLNKGHPLNISSSPIRHEPYYTSRIGTPGMYGAYTSFKSTGFMPIVHIYCEVHGFAMGKLYNPLNINPFSYKDVWTKPTIRPVEKERLKVSFMSWTDLEDDEEELEEDDEEESEEDDDLFIEEISRSSTSTTSTNFSTIEADLKSGDADKILSAQTEIAKLESTNQYVPPNVLELAANPPPAQVEDEEEFLF